MTLPLILVGLVLIMLVMRQLHRSQRRVDPFMRRHTDGVRRNYKRHP